MLYDPAKYLELLLRQTPVALPSLVGGRGLYSLSDEKGIVRYIGETGNPFYDRIHNRHCAGDDNSHKYSTVFNAGRFWQPASCDKNQVKHSVNDQADGKNAKALRTLFARTRCFARTIPLPDLGASARKDLEAAILQLTPIEHKLWNDSRNLIAYEPDGIEQFMREVGWPDHKIEAVNRQKARWDSLDERDRLVVRGVRKPKPV